MKLKNVIYSINDTSLVEGILEIIPSLKIELVSRTELEALWDLLQSFELALCRGNQWVWKSWSYTSLSWKQKRSLFISAGEKFQTIDGLYRKTTPGPQT